MTETAAPLAASAATTARPSTEGAGPLGPVPDGWTRAEVEDFLYREARLADENEYDAWEALWTDDALYWVPAGGPGTDPLSEVSIIFDNRNRIATRMKQVRTGKRYAQAPPSHLRRVVGNVELLGGRPNHAGGVDLEVGANFLAVESKPRGNELWAGRTTYRLRRQPGPDGAAEIRLAFKKVVLVDNDKPVPTLAFLV
ncbi:aromatic-ring-hydroxylating dioxygenase subunit beta [Nocardioides zeae]|uniref:Aromatic-ring-hydroxylating dioxygenase subunit beta n=1 Tax=Nocardioides zeae TaxID=1457234 RepID=A0A6P0HFZ4_9ACTN|nr:aromatic-ring-hydroxylating dioxygenase subunit beta [Nocardioides zeae]NEN77619.1 aromatic-ring-hydroxylating dioxygenase subunit beta [Nocardioides zeae]